MNPCRPGFGPALSPDEPTLASARESAAHKRVQRPGADSGGFGRLQHRAIRHNQSEALADTAFRDKPVSFDLARAVSAWHGDELSGEVHRQARSHAFPCLIRLVRIEPQSEAPMRQNR